MRFADLDGTPIDVYQQNTDMNDEASQAYPATVNALLDNALGPQGYYGAFGTNMHTDDPAPHAGAEAIVASAQARGVPVDLVQAAARLDGRPQQLDDPRPQLERRHAHLHHHRRQPAPTACRRCCRPRARPAR